VEVEEQHGKKIKILNWLAAVIHKNERNAAGNSDTVVHSWSIGSNKHVWINAEQNIAGKTKNYEC